MSGSRIARIAVFAALVAVLGLTPAMNLPGFPVPVTVQTMGVMLAGLMLVPAEAFLSVALFVGLVAAGLPLLPGGRGGLGVFAGPSSGFIIGFPFAAAAVAVSVLLLRRLGAPATRRTEVLLYGTAAVLGGVVVLYAIAVPISAAIIDYPIGAYLTGTLSFLPGDLAKAVAATLVATAAFRAAPELRPALPAPSRA